MSNVTFQRVVKQYGNFTALQSLDLEINEGEFLTLLGPSGCGKTTTLRLIAGFIMPSEGRIFLDNTEITNLAPQDRNVGMVFQDYALFPHLTIAENIAFGLVERRMDKASIALRVKDLLNLIEMPDVGDRYPAQISGGQRQRVALARAVAYAPRVLLMDEPLGALDLKLRETMQVELRRIQKDLGITAVYVTHDQTEAITMSDRIVIMNHGVLEQIGSAEEIYEKPATKFVAGFVGQINFLQGRVVEQEGSTIVVEIDGARIFAKDALTNFEIGEPATFSIRPERLKLRPIDSSVEDGHSLPVRVEEIDYAGNLMHTTVRTSAGRKLVCEYRPDESEANIGDEVLAIWDVDSSLLLRE
jgi:spermidine/putrescine ABC transporter ATP-binding subunit